MYQDLADVSTAKVLAMWANTAKDKWESVQTAPTIPTQKEVKTAETHLNAETAAKTMRHQTPSAPFIKWSKKSFY